MADEGPDNRKLRTRKLPPLASAGGAEVNETDETVPKPRPKKKKRPAASKPAAEGQTKGESEAGEQPADEESGKKAGEGAPPVRKKKKRPRPKPAADPDADVVDGGADESGAVVDGDKETPKPRKPRKKSPRRKDPTSSQQSLLIPSDGEGETPRDRKVRRKKRTPRSSSTNVKEDEYSKGGLAADLNEIEEDVIDTSKKAEDETEAEDEDEDEDVIKVPPSGVTLRSQPASKLYIEQRTKFRQEDKKKLAKRLAEEEERRIAAETEMPTKTTTLEAALSSQKVLRIFSLFIHGILGGFVLCQCTFVLLALISFDPTFFLDLYTMGAWPVQVAVYLMLVICTLSALDKYDVCRMNRRFLIQCLTLQNGAISILFYFIALILSLSIADVDDKIRAYSKNATQHWAEGSAAFDELDTWKNVNIARATFVIVAWFVIALQPTFDRLTQNLRSGEENILGDVTILNSVSAI